MFFQQNFYLKIIHIIQNLELRHKGLMDAHFILLQGNWAKWYSLHFIMLLPLLCIIEFSNLILEPIELSWAFKEGMLLVHPWHSAQMVAFWSCPSFAPEIILTLWNSSCTPHFISMLSTIWEGRSYIWSQKYIQIYGIFLKHWHKWIQNHWSSLRSCVIS